MLSLLLLIALVDNSGSVVEWRGSAEAAVVKAKLVNEEAEI